MVTIINPFSKKPLYRSGNELKDDEKKSFRIVSEVPRFVKDDNYTESFGFQWNKFQKTQIDRESKNSNFSKDRFFTVTDWDKEDLIRKDILEAGSGAGRFTQIVMDYTGANLYSFDYSDAVSANYRNNAHHGDRLKLFQASIYEMPFPDNSFDKVFCFGVLQHTPDFRASIKCLVDKAKPGGEIIVDFYPIKGWYTKIHSKYILRPFTKNMSHEKLLTKIEKNANRLIGAYKFFDRIGLGKIAHRFLPVCDINRTLPANLSKEELREWVILDTFDMFSPVYDNPQRIDTVKKWMEESGAEITFAGFKTYAHNLRIAVVKGIKKREGNL
jgi:SAM-dependent methyltransferase